MNRDSSNLRVLITGATGFIGSALVSYLNAKGFKIRALTRDIRHMYVQNNPHYEWIQGDLTVLDDIQDICKNIDVVFHAAGFAHACQNADLLFQEKHRKINYEATTNLASQAALFGVKRFIFFSTVKASADSYECVDENWQVFPKDVYGLTKRAAEEKLYKIHAETQMDCIILRLALVYGVGWKGNLNAMLKAIDKKWFPPVSKILNQKSMVAIDNVCKAAELAATMPLKTQRLFIITDNVHYSISDIYQLMREALGLKKIDWSLPFWMWRCFGKIGDLLQKIVGRRLPMNSEAVEKLYSNTAYVSAHTKNEIGFMPKTIFSDKLPEIVAAYRKQVQ